MDYWKIQHDRSTSSSSDIDNIMQYYTTNRVDDAKKTESVSGSSITLTESNVGTFVEQVTGESLRYTARDMDVIRQEARLNAQGSREEIEEMKIVCAGFEAMMIEQAKMHNRKLIERDTKMGELIDERDDLQENVTSMDVAFKDLHNRYSRLRGTLEKMRKNDQDMKNAVRQYESRLKQEEERYDQLKANSQDLVRRANEEIAAVEDDQQKELLKVQTELKLLKLKNDNLEAQVARKTTDNEELTKICDELIANQSN